MGRALQEEQEKLRRQRRLKRDQLKLQLQQMSASEQLGPFVEGGDCGQFVFSSTNCEKAPRSLGVSLKLVERAEDAAIRRPRKLRSKPEPRVTLEREP